VIDVLVVDDHPIVRQGLREIVAATDDIRIVGEATSGREALERLRATRCDVVLLDLSLPDVDGLEVLKRVRLERRTPVLVLTMHSEDEFAVRALRAGASGYLTKESAPAELVSAVRKVVGGGRYISVALAERLAAYLGPEADRPAHERLSDREYQILRLMAAGKTKKVIAGELGLSPKTVATYRVRLLEKLGMRTSAELTAYAIRHGLNRFL